MSPPGEGGEGGEAVAALNAGSSSIKFALFSADAAPEEIMRGQIEHVTHADGDALLRELESHLDGRRLVAIGHRIVHGGSRFVAPVRLTPEIIAALRDLTPLAPLHQPLGLAPIEAVATARPRLTQIACFDTAFHHDLRPPASRYAIPRAFEAKGIRRYGFHGLSYEYIARRLKETSAPGRKVVVAHLGSGASLCAMLDGRSIDTTMGFSALDGLVMATRPGAIDPGILLYLLKQEGFTPDRLEQFLYHECGLLGVSGLSADMRDLLGSDDPRAAEAIDLFAFSISRHIAEMANSLGGLDVLVFSGGIGEHAPVLRAMVAARLGWLGAVLDEAANRAAAPRISAAGSRIELRIIPTDEELIIAEHTVAALGRS